MRFRVALLFSAGLVAFMYLTDNGGATALALQKEKGKKGKGPPPGAKGSLQTKDGPPPLPPDVQAYSNRLDADFNNADRNNDRKLDKVELAKFFRGEKAEAAPHPVPQKDRKKFPDNEFLMTYDDDHNYELSEKEYKGYVDLAVATYRQQKFQVAQYQRKIEAKVAELEKEAAATRDMARKVYFRGQIVEQNAALRTHQASLDVWKMGVRETYYLINRGVR